MNQWELEAHLIGWVGGASFLTEQSQSVVKQNQSNSAMTSDTQLKTALTIVAQTNVTSAILFLKIGFHHNIRVVDEI